MGQKVHPISFRLGITESWRSKWYARKQGFGRLIIEDKKIRDFVTSQYAFAGIARVDIARTRDEVRVTLHCARPGVIIGRKGVEVDFPRYFENDRIIVKIPVTKREGSSKIVEKFKGIDLQEIDTLLSLL